MRQLRSRGILIRILKLEWKKSCRGERELKVVLVNLRFFGVPFKVSGMRLDSGIIDTYQVLIVHYI